MDDQIGKKEWEEIHGIKLEILPSFAGYGWKWQPQLCECRNPHTLAQDKRTKQGKT